ncbi:hypothetical protein A4X09_0g4556 [Tilletia walkeri]|uniref:PB1 domain-containing protein n=1 Tax=Tilletia walkeri TaxID=117179 RepID=A0A8X7T4X8_9BASI|nr:hypothetical protein A4X09_0g4556 [Tilletia walkeri]
MPFRIKANLHPSPAHRVATVPNKDSLTLDFLTTRLAALWNVDSTQIDITYIDADGDLIAISTEEDRLEWIESVVGDGNTSAKLTLVPRPPMSVNPLASGAPSVVHNNNDIGSSVAGGEDEDDGFEAIDVDSDDDEGQADESQVPPYTIGDNATAALPMEKTPLTNQDESNAADASTSNAKTPDAIENPEPSASTPNAEANPVQELGDAIISTVDAVVAGALDAIASTTSALEEGAQRSMETGPTSETTNATDDTQAESASASPRASQGHGHGRADGHYSRHHHHHHHPYASAGAAPAHTHEHAHGHNAHTHGHGHGHRHHHHGHRHHHRHHGPPPPPPPGTGPGEGGNAPPFFGSGGPLPFGLSRDGVTLGPMHIPFHIPPQIPFPFAYGPQPQAGPHGPHPHPHDAPRPQPEEFDWNAIFSVVEGAAGMLSSQAENLRRTWGAPAVGVAQELAEQADVLRRHLGPGLRELRGAALGAAAGAARDAAEAACAQYPFLGGRGGGAGFGGGHHSRGPWGQGQGQGHGRQRAGCGRHRHRHQAEEGSREKKAGVTDLEEAMEQVMHEDANRAGGAGPSSSGSRRGQEGMTVDSDSSSTSSSSSSSSSDSETEGETKDQWRHCGKTKTKDQAAADDAGGSSRRRSKRECRSQRRHHPHGRYAPPSPAAAGGEAAAQFGYGAVPLPLWADQARATMMHGAGAGGWTRVHGHGHGRAGQEGSSGPAPAVPAAVPSNEEEAAVVDGRSTPRPTHSQTRDNTTPNPLLTTTPPSTDTPASSSTSTGATTASGPLYTPRNWLDVTGKHSVEGTFIPSRSASARGRVKLLLSSSSSSGGADKEKKPKLVEIRLGQLCVEDRVWAEREQEAAAAARAAEKEQEKSKGKGKGKARE